MQEVGRRIERIDVPGVTLVGPLDASALLQDEAVARTRLGEFLIEGLLRALVGQTDKVPRALQRHLKFADLAEIAFKAATGLDGGAGHHSHQSGSDHGRLSSAAETGAALWKAPRRGKCAPPRATLAHSIDVRNKTPSTRPIGVVFGAEGFAEQALLGSNARQQDTERQNGNDDAHPRAERQAPTKHEDEETEITRVANDPVEPTGDQPMFGLDRNQAAEATSKHEDRREAKNAAGRIKENTEPAHAF